MTNTSRHRKRQQGQPPASGRAPRGKLSAQDREAICQALSEYHRAFDDCFSRHEQRQWSRLYLCGQLSNLERKTIEPMVLGLLGAKPNVVRAVQTFINESRWSAQQVIERHQTQVSATLSDAGGVVIVDGSGFPKQGKHSVGVARQYCGQLGKVANCQEGVFVVYNSRHGYTFLNGRLYVPEAWFDQDHRARWSACGIPNETRFRTEPQLALEMVRDLVVRDVIGFQWVTCDEHFGQNPSFLDGVAALNKWYFAEVPSDTRVWLHTPTLEPPAPSLLGRPRIHWRVKRDAPRAQEMRELVTGLSKARWHRLTIHEGSQGPLLADFAFVRVTTVRNRLPGPRVWAIFRRSVSDPTQVKYYLSNASTACAPQTLARISGQRWPIETVFEEAKGELGMDHYETRTWKGWHHHMAQTFLAHHFLTQVRLRLKKVTRIDHGASTTARGQFDQRREMRIRCVGHHRLPSTSQSRRLSFPSQTHFATSSKTQAKLEKVESLVVMEVSL